MCSMFLSRAVPPPLSGCGTISLRRLPDASQALAKELTEGCVVGCLNDSRQALEELLVSPSPSGLFGSKVGNQCLHQPLCGSHSDLCLTSQLCPVTLW